MNHDRLLLLNQKVKNKTATQSEKDELMQLLYSNGSITKNQYDSYKEGKNTDSILDTALLIAGIVLFGYIISELAKQK